MSLAFVPPAMPVRNARLPSSVKITAPSSFCIKAFLFRIFLLISFRTKRSAICTSEFFHQIQCQRHSARQIGMIKSDIRIKSNCVPKPRRTNLPASYRKTTAVHLHYPTAASCFSHERKSLLLAGVSADQIRRNRLRQLLPQSPGDFVCCRTPEPAPCSGRDIPTFLLSAERPGASHSLWMHALKSTWNCKSFR